MTSILVTGGAGFIGSRPAAATGERARRTVVDSVGRRGAQRNLPGRGRRR